MKYFTWNAEKNEQLKTERGVSFEEIVFHIESGDVLDVIDHPNFKKYPHQKMYVVGISDYVFLVPFVQTNEERFLKTIIPSRKATKLYLGNADEEED